MPLPPLTPNRSLADAADRRALRTLQLGALLVVLAALPWKVFELDRFFVPKELVLHAVAPARRASRVAASALAATNPWLAARALALSASGAALFWTGRRLAAVGLDGPLLTTLAAATALAAGTALAQAYGIRSEYFSLNRAPGGTFGNRNFVAHLAAIGTPLLVLALLRARAAGGVVVSAVGLAATTALLVLSRSRGAWLAAGASLLPLAIGVVRASRLPTGERLPTRRLALAAFLPAVGIAAALALPNRLDWRSGSPYLDSMKGVVDYRGGSGRGRLQQYANSARMTADHPLLGVGPGNWAVRYPRWAPRGDPSLTPERATANPWPSSDWVAVASERGIPAFCVLAAFVVALLWQAHLAAWRSFDPARVLLGATLGAALVATVVVGLFDAVLLLAAPAFIAWPALGALSSASAPAPAPWRAAPPSPVWRVGVGLLAAASLAGVLRSAAQSAAMSRFVEGSPAAIARAARLDPGSYRIRLRAGELAAAGRRCADARVHAGALVRLFPEAAAPRRLMATCTPRRRRASAR